MKRLGGRLHWGTHRFNVLASDEDDILEDSAIFGAHPDRNNIAPLLWYQDADVNGGQSSGVTGTGGVGGPAGGGRFTYTRWHFQGNPYTSGRGEVDRNFLREDGAAFRIADIAITHFQDQMKAQAHGLARAPIFSGANGYPTYFTLLPTAP